MDGWMDGGTAWMGTRSVSMGDGCRGRVEQSRVWVVYRWILPCMPLFVFGCYG